MVKMVANMHGNEPVGRELLLHLARHILRSSGPSDGVLAATDLYVLPTMNPDGFERAREGRCDGINYSAGRLSEGVHRDKAHKLKYMRRFSFFRQN